MTIDTEVLFDLYVNKGIGTNKLALFFNVHRATIQRQLKKLKIPLRKTSPHTSYDINFFKEYNPASCYWAGFIMADGCIRSERSTLEIGLHNKDRDHLVKFLTAINKEYIHIVEYEDVSKISISGKWFCDDLLTNFNITPRKSLTVAFPTDLPVEFYNHFIRGYFDGDGCITRSSCTLISILGTHSFLDTVRHIFFETLYIKLKSKNLITPIHKNEGNVYSIHYSGKNAFKILDWLYADSEKSIRLDRKYKRYIDYQKL